MLNFLHDSKTFIEGLVVGLVAYEPAMRYILKPVGYAAWDDLKALWNVLIRKEQSAISGVLPTNG